MRGEYRLPQTFHPPIKGSSPHARGIPRSTKATGSTRGFIPACAGNTPASLTKRFTASVHPRMRGEYQPSSVQILSNWGSSPHARGIPRYTYQLVPTWRFIPACAGNTIDGRLVEDWNKVHPRMRGEYGALAEVVLPR